MEEELFNEAIKLKNEIKDIKELRGMYLSLPSGGNYHVIDDLDSRLITAKEALIETMDKFKEAL